MAAQSYSALNSSCLFGSPDATSSKLSEKAVLILATLIYQFAVLSSFFALS
jgi:hypothetical protein